PGRARSNVWPYASALATAQTRGRSPCAVGIMDCRNRRRLWAIASALTRAQGCSLNVPSRAGCIDAALARGSLIAGSRHVGGGSQAQVVVAVVSPIPDVLKVMPHQAQAMASRLSLIKRGSQLGRTSLCRIERQAVVDYVDSQDLVAGVNGKIDIRRGRVVARLEAIHENIGKRFVHT